MTRAVAALAAAAALGLAGCGGEAGDLMLVRRDGTIPGAAIALRFTEDGRVACGRGPLRLLRSAQTIEARDAQRRLSGKDHPGPAARHVHLAPGPGSVLRYRVSMAAGDVAFADTSRGQPPVFFRVAKLTRDVSRSICRYPR